MLVAFAGATVAVSFSVWPFAVSVASFLSRVTPVTATVVGWSAMFTVTLHTAVLFPSAVVTVMSAVPFATAVTSPSGVTVATFSLLVAYVTFLLVAFAGATIAVSFTVWPFAVRVASVLFRVTPVTATACFSHFAKSVRF